MVLEERRLLRWAFGRGHVWGCGIVEIWTVLESVGERWRMLESVGELESVEGYDERD